MKALDALIEVGVICVVGLLILAFYQRSVAARYSASQDAATAQLELNAGNSIINALFGWQPGSQSLLGL
ncbi:MAG TPA: hypothetical protein VHB45_14335 [Alloacidobacterium sp.]|nr:hypothetical protein [Alloacidobacterium sp.]